MGVNLKKVNRYLEFVTERCRRQDIVFLPLVAETFEGEGDVGQQAPILIL